MWTTITSVIPVDSMIWLKKLESRMQKSECTSLLHYSMFCTLHSVFCPALNLFLFLIVHLYVTMYEEYLFHKTVCDIFSHDTYVTKILQWKLFSWIQFTSAHTTYLHIITKRWLKWSYRLTWQYRGCMFLRLGTWSVYLSVVKLYH